MNKQRLFRITMVLVLFVLVTILSPGLDDSSRTSRSLTTKEGGTENEDNQTTVISINTTRHLQEYVYNPYLTHLSRPSQVELVCLPGSEPYYVDWNRVGFDPDLPKGDVQSLTLPDGEILRMKMIETQCAASPPFIENGKLSMGLHFLVYPDWIPNNTPGNRRNEAGGEGGYGYENLTPVDTSVVLPFPSDRYCTTEFEFEQAVDSAFFSVAGITSDVATASVVRISMSDEDGTNNDLYMARTGTSLRVNQNYAYQWEAGSQKSAPPALSSLYAKSNKRVKKIRVDHSAYSYVSFEVDNGFAMGVSIFPGFDFGFCAPSDDTVTPVSINVTETPTPLPTPIPETPTPAPTPIAETPTPVPTLVLDTQTAAPTLIILDTQTPAPTVPPTVPQLAIPAGTSGDPIIMGLSGQIFKFNGHSGAWYSAASAKSFQWNMKIQQFEGCPQSSDTFITGVGLTVFEDKEMKTKEHKISVEVVNEYSTAVGCGNRLEKKQDFGCLGAGSLELMIDGHKFVQSVDRQLDDESGRVIVFNTIAKCSRRWFDFDITPPEEIGVGNATAESRRRRLEYQYNVFELMEGVKDTMVDKEGCEAWMKERRKKGDLFKQTGTWSTVLIKTDKISLHIEYKQEQERCNAHSLDVWISEVSPDVHDEDWEGVIGETKDKSWERVEPKHVDRAVALKYPDDDSYEVLSPFSKKCKACVQRD